MESSLDRIIALCNEAKTKLNAYNKYNASFSLASDKSQPLEVRYKAAQSLFDKASENVALWEASQSALKTVNKSLVDLSDQFTSELSRSENKADEYNKVYCLLKSVEEERFAVQMHALTTSSQTKIAPKITDKQLASLLPRYISKVEQQKIEMWMRKTTSRQTHQFLERKSIKLRICVT
ncbi:hypothetical protein EIN_438280 [Entamoeba invadens IP1]|uniref:Uncharacterized protein n=1 Tax=Entamoeba invadens IP1 TaxID=370355 RepID=A0A0A1U3J7_ENTIV|nr:hypothetical protein EIN_438280 [Entamoeba invadens IP1]ELP88798.1 hypothetical protein EIN_438280 [Entamoeba invadens IP1]|eukprot:XP_004255569.1 hypothetical protein EIN_438280 [Entamoeba invadens IP1]